MSSDMFSVIANRSQRPTLLQFLQDHHLIHMGMISKPIIQTMPDSTIPTHALPLTNLSTHILRVGLKSQPAHRRLCYRTI